MKKFFKTLAPDLIKLIKGRMRPNNISASSPVVEKYRNSKSNLRKLKSDYLSAVFIFEDHVRRFSDEKAQDYQNSIFDNDRYAEYLRRTDSEMLEMKTRIARMEAEWTLFDEAIEESEHEPDELIALVAAFKSPQ